MVRQPIELTCGVHLLRILARRRLVALTAATALAVGTAIASAPGASAGLRDHDGKYGRRPTTHGEISTHLVGQGAAGRNGVSARPSPNLVRVVVALTVVFPAGHGTDLVVAPVASRTRWRASPRSGMTPSQRICSKQLTKTVAAPRARAPAKARRLRQS